MNQLSLMILSFYGFFFGYWARPCNLSKRGVESEVVADNLGACGLHLKVQVVVQDYKKITDHFRGIYGIYLKSMKKFRKITTHNQLNLETLGF